MGFRKKDWVIWLKRRTPKWLYVFLSKYLRINIKVGINLSTDDQLYISEWPGQTTLMNESSQAIFYKLTDKSLTFELIDTIEINGKKKYVLINLSNNRMIKIPEGTMRDLFIPTQNLLSSFHSMETLHDP